MNNVTFDPAKDSVNLEKHGFSLSDAGGFEWDDALVWPDKRRDYDEARMVGWCQSMADCFAWCLSTARQSNRQNAALSV